MSKQSANSSDGHPGIEERLDSLESQLAFQEHTIDALNQLVTEQSQLIARMKKHMGVLAEKVQQHDAQFDEQPNDERPPHY